MRFPKSIRLPRETYADPNKRFHLTVAAHPEVRAFAKPVGDAVWGSVLEQRTARRVQLLAACLMPDHLHLVVGPLDQDVITFVQRWKSWSTRLAWAAGHRGPLWQPSVWDRSIRDGEDFDTVCLYVVRNPVSGGLVEDEADWPWSWAIWMDGGRDRT